MIERIAALSDVGPGETARTKDDDLPGWWFVDDVRPLDDETMAVYLRSPDLAAYGWHLLPPDHRVLITEQ